MTFVPSFSNMCVAYVPLNPVPLLMEDLPYWKEELQFSGRPFLGQNTTQQLIDISYINIICVFKQSPFAKLLL